MKRKSIKKNNTKKQKLLFIIVTIVTLLCINTIVKLIIPKNDEIKDGYIAVFNGGSGEMTFSTYIYKINNNKSNYGYEYINTVNTTTYWGSSDWNIKIKKSGKFNSPNNAFTIAKAHGAYDYVEVTNHERIYSIEEFEEIFLID